MEGPETVTLTLLSKPAYSLSSRTQATVTINDDEPMLTITALATNIVEGSKPPAVFRLTRTGDPKYNFTAHLAVGGTATFGVDYPPFLTNVYFSCGVVSIDLLVAPTNELVIEGDETVTATIIPDPAYTILQGSFALNILDAGENQTPVVTITSPTASTVFLSQTNVNIILEAAVSDDSASNIVTWTQVSGPPTMVFGSTNGANNTASFTGCGRLRCKSHRG